MSVNAEPPPLEQQPAAGALPLQQQHEQRPGSACLLELRRENEQIDKENQLMEAFLVKAQQQGLTPPDSSKLKAKASRRRREPAADAAAAAAAEAVQRLSDEEKNEIVGQAIEALQAEIEQTRASDEKDVGDISTLMQEVETRIAEAKKATYEFKRDVIIGGEDGTSGRTSADKVLRFLKDQLHAKEVLVEKLTLKNATAKAAIGKLTTQLAHKEEMGEVLHQVDFEQLKIEHQTYLLRIGAKNRELLQLKLATGRTVQVLNDVKRRMAALLAQRAQLAASLASRAAELGEFEAEFAAAAGQSAAAAAAVRRLAGQQKDVDQTRILDYLKLKARVGELAREAAEWRRKAEVARGGGAAGRLCSR